MTDILMPRLSDTMEEGVVASWSKKVGDEVKKGDVIGEIETDKTTMDLEAYDSGILEKLLVEEGGTVAIGEPIAVLGDGSGSSDSGDAKSDGGNAEADSNDDKAEGDEAEADSVDAKSDGDDGKSHSEDDSDKSDGESGTDEESTTSEEPAEGDSGVRRSPLARRMAREHGIDLSTVKGTGPGGRIIRTDVERVVAEQGDGKPSGSKGSDAQGKDTSSGVPAAKAPQGVTGEAGDADESVKLSANQRITAERLGANAGAPTFQESITVRVDDLLAFRKTLNAGLDGSKVSVNDLFVKACARTLKDHPEINSSWGGDSIIRRGEINVGIAVALNGGLIVPVVKNTDRKTLTEVSDEARELAGRAKDGKLRPEEFKGGTFSISNLGMYGIDHFTALINPPEAAILAVGAAKEEPYIEAGKLAERSVITMTMTVDHRVVNGAEAAVFLNDLKSVLEDPLKIVV